MAVHEEVTALNTAGTDATSLGLPPQGIVLWQVDELHVYAIGARWIKLLALVARGTYSNQVSLTKLGREIDQVPLNQGVLADDQDVAPGRVGSVGGYTIAVRQEGEVEQGEKRWRRRGGVVGGSGSIHLCCLLDVVSVEISEWR
jgi:hypothetical protein